jgi:hypothetical protein
MKIYTTIHNNHLITTEEGSKFGIFFRSPIQKVSYDAYYADYSKTSAWTYKSKIKNPIRRLYEIIIGNKSIVDHIEEWSQSIDWGGFTANKLMSPIYFKREYRYLKAESGDPNDLIQKIVSYGYEGPYNYCSGACHIERTKITLKNGKRVRLKVKDRYKYTYVHIIEEMLSSGNIDDN